MKQKYYVVKRGWVEGIYRTWEECSEQVQGFSGAIYKSFSNLESALKYMNEGSKQENWYAVVKGRRPGIYKTWAECYAQIHKYSGAVYKLFGCYEDAAEFIDDYVEWDND